MKSGMQSAVLRSAGKAATAGLDTATTLAYRWPLLLSADSAREWQSAWIEKVVAMQSGMFAAGLAWQRLLWDMGSSGISPAKLLGVGDAMMAPAYRKVAANAKRLTGGR